VSFSPLLPFVTIPLDPAWVKILTLFALVRIPWAGDGPQAAVSSLTGYSFILQASNMNNCPYSCFRPVGLAFDTQGRLFGTSDMTGEVSNI
jgi:hypothetical protein